MEESYSYYLLILANLRCLLCSLDLVILAIFLVVVEYFGNALLLLVYLIFMLIVRHGKWAGKAIPTRDWFGFDSVKVGS